MCIKTTPKSQLMSSKNENAQIMTSAAENLLGITSLPTILSITVATILFWKEIEGDCISFLMQSPSIIS